MFSYRSFIAVTVLSVGTAAPATAQFVSDGGFQSGGLVSVNDNPKSPTWAFVGGSGLIRGVNAEWQTPDRSEGQFAFLRTNARHEKGEISTTIVLPTSGLYSLSFLNSARQGGCCGGNTLFDVFLGKTEIGEFSTHTGDGWSAKGTTFTANAGTYTLRFLTQTRLPGDNTAFIDNVSVDVVTTPEPASLALFATGLFSLAGISARRKRQV